MRSAHERQYDQYSNDPAWTCNVQFHNEFSEESEDEYDVVVLKQDLWKAISSITHDNIEGRVAISLRRNQVASTNASSNISSLTCWAVSDTAHPLGNDAALSCPVHWVKNFEEIFDNGEMEAAKCLYTVTLAHVIPLSEVVLTTSSSSAYAFVQNHSSGIRRELARGRRVLRLKDDFIFRDRQGKAGAPSTYGFKIISLSPISQGSFDVRKTRLITVSSSEIDNSLSPQRNANETEDIHLNSLETYKSEYASTKLGRQFEIDENFLASHTLRSSLSILSDLEDHNDPNNKSRLGGLLTSDTSSKSEDLTSNSQNGLLSYKDHHLAINVEIISQRDDENTLYDEDSVIHVHTTALGRIGVFSNDWVCVAASKSHERRLAKVVNADFDLDHDQEIRTSPILFSNIVGNRSIRRGCQISITPTPFGPRSPTIPTAKMATLARVASPITTDKFMQSNVVQALRKYFLRHRRLLKKGDIVAVNIDQNNMIVREEDAGTLLKNDIILSYNTFASHAPPLTAFFVVTNLEYDVPSGSAEIDINNTMEYISGELGCWIDPKSTKLIQAGVEHSQVPSAETRSMHNFGENRPFSAIYDLLNAAFEMSQSCDDTFTILLQDTDGSHVVDAIEAAAEWLGMHLIHINSFDMIGDTDVQTQAVLKSKFMKALSCAPCILLLEDVDALYQSTQLGESRDIASASVIQECVSGLSSGRKAIGYSVVTIATTKSISKLPKTTLSCFKEELQFKALDEMERHRALKRALLALRLSTSSDVALDKYAVQTAALSSENILDLVFRADINATRHINELICTSPYIHKETMQAGLLSRDADFVSALGDVRKSYSQIIGAPQIPSVTWDDVGGLVAVKSEILDTIQLPLEHPELFVDGIKKRSGILLYGPPGTGKTLLAKAVATSCSLNFLSVKGPELLNMYIGESEANVRRIFSRARDAKPCVIFFDELDSIAPRRGNHGDSGGVMDRIVSQLLAELDGMSISKHMDVFVMGATNRPDLLDPALLRPGRFDRMLYLGVSKTHEAQLDIMRALTRHFKLHPDLDLSRIAQACPLHYTGADLYALCSDAMLKAISDKADAIERKISALNSSADHTGHPFPLTSQYYMSISGDFADSEVLITQNHFDEALNELIPSVSEDEMNHYLSIQERFAGYTKDHLNM